MFKVKKINLLAVIFLILSIVLILIAPQSKLGYAILISGDLLLLYSLIKEKLEKSYQKIKDAKIRAELEAML